MNEIFKFAPFSLGANQGEFTARISSTGRDLDGDTITTKALEGVSISNLIPVLRDHDEGKIVGAIHAITVQGDELIAKGRLFDPESRLDAKAGTHGLSMGFRGTGTKTNTGIQYDDVRLFEVSMTESPSNVDTEFLSVKHRDQGGNANGTTRTNGADPDNEQLNAIAKDVKKMKVQIIDMRDELERKTTTAKDDPDPEFVDFSPGTVYLDPMKLITKDYTTSENPAGSKQDAVNPWYAKPLNNPFMELIGQENVVTVDGGSFSVPEISGLAFTRRANDPDSATGGLSDSDVTSRNFVSYSAFSLAARDDLPMLREAALMGIGLELDASIAAEVFRIIKASNDDSTAGTIASGATTGTATGFPSTTEVVTQLAALRQAVKHQYRADRMHTGFVLASGVVTPLLQAQSTAGEWAIDPLQGDMLYTFPLREYDGMDGAGTDGNVVGVFGNFMDGVCVGFTTQLEVIESEHMNAGKVSYLARARFGVTVKDDEALRTMTVGT